MTGVFTEGYRVRSIKYDILYKVYKDKIGQADMAKHKNWHSASRKRLLKKKLKSLKKKAAL